MEALKNRKLKSGKQYDSIIPRSKGVSKRTTGDVFKTLRVIKQIVQTYKGQVSKLSQKLQGKDLEETLSKVWHFVYEHIQYAKDHPEREQLHLPARIWDKRHQGVDCDDYSIFISAILSNLNIPHYLRMTKYWNRNLAEKLGNDYKPNWQHVYIIVPTVKKPNLDYKSNDYITLDCVTDTFKKEVEYFDNYDMEMEILGNLPDPELDDLDFANDFDLGSLDEVDDDNDSLILFDLEDNDKQLSGLSGGQSLESWQHEHLRNKLGEEHQEFLINDPELDDLEFNNDFGIETLTGFGLSGNHEDPSPKDVYNGAWRGLKNHLKSTLRKVEEEPSAYGEMGYALKSSIEYTLSVWDNPVERERAINLFSNDNVDIHEQELQGLGSFWKNPWKSIKKTVKKVASKVWKSVKKAAKWVGNAIKKTAKAVGNFAGKVWKTVKKVGSKIWKGIKKVGVAIWRGVVAIGKFLMKINPIIILARAGVRLWLNKNWNNSAGRLGFALFDKATALKKGISLSSYNKCVSSYKRTYNLYVNIMQGKRSKLEDSIKKGHNRKYGKGHQLHLDKKYQNPISPKKASDKEIKKILSDGLKLDQKFKNKKFDVHVTEKRKHTTYQKVRDYEAEKRRKRSSSSNSNEMALRRRIESLQRIGKGNTSLSRKYIALYPNTSFARMLKEEPKDSNRRTSRRSTSSRHSNRSFRSDRYGRGGVRGLEGIEGLGAVATASTGAAAGGFIAKILAFLAKIGKVIWKGIKVVGKAIGKGAKKVASIFKKKGASTLAKKSKALTKLKSTKAGKLLTKADKTVKAFKATKTGKILTKANKISDAVQQSGIGKKYTQVKNSIEQAVEKKNALIQKFNNTKDAVQKSAIAKEYTKIKNEIEKGIRIKNELLQQLKPDSNSTKTPTNTGTSIPTKTATSVDLKNQNSTNNASSTGLLIGAVVLGVGALALGNSENKNKPK